MNRKVLLTIIIALCITALTACNTIHGMGKDIEKGGEAIQKAAH